MHLRLTGVGALGPQCYHPTMRACGVALIVAASIAGAACASRDGAAGPLGSQPQSRASAYPYTEIWRTPYPTPLGTAGLTGIPPRPSFVPRLAHTFTPAPSRSPGTAWTTPDDAGAALSGYRPEVPARADVSTRAQLTPGCPFVDRDVAVADVEAFYAEARRALLAAGFELAYEIDREHDGSFGVVLRADTAAVRAEISTGSIRGVFPAPKTTLPYLVRTRFTQRCDR